ncbi:MAG TPA: DNRLRE domain-containing protein [Luteolibacter sp.]
MKTRIPARTALAVIATGICLAASASGQTTTWYSDTTNNSAIATGTAANTFIDLGSTNWKDTYIRQDQASTNFGNSTSIQVNRDGTIANDVSIIMVGWNNLNITDTVTAARYYFTLEGAAVAGTSNTWYVVGINGSQGAWTETGATWTNSNTLVDQVNYATTNYGTFTYAGNFADYNDSTKWFSIDVKDALADYKAGTISGIALINNTSSGAATGTAQRLQLNTAEETNANLRPGMLVTTTPVPEPATVSLGLIGAVGLLIRRRR